MIVVDTNVVAYLLLPGSRTEAARSALLADPDWAAPFLWRSEFRSVLAAYLNRRELSVADAMELYSAAVGVLGGAEFEPDPSGVLRLAVDSNCSAYDCEFVTLAQELGVSMVTVDRRILREFPETAVALEQFG